MKPKSQLIKRLDTIEEKIKGDSGASATAIKAETLSSDSSAKVTEGKDEA